MCRCQALFYPSDMHREEDMIGGMVKMHASPVAHETAVILERHGMSGSRDHPIRIARDVLANFPNVEELMAPAMALVWTCRPDQDSTATHVAGCRIVTMNHQSSRRAPRLR